MVLQELRELYYAAQSQVDNIYNCEANLPHGFTVNCAARNFGWCSYVFAVVTGYCIGSLTLSNIIGVAYINKRMTLGRLVLIAIIFEGIGMLTMSKYILD